MLLNGREQQQYQQHGNEWFGGPDKISSRVSSIIGLTFRGGGGPMNPALSVCDKSFHATLMAEIFAGTYFRAADLRGTNFRGYFRAK